jgi:hypothetical protein
MSHLQIKSIEQAARNSGWSSDVYNHQPNFSEVAMALLPASLILAAASALLVALL